VRNGSAKQTNGTPVKVTPDYKGPYTIVHAEQITFSNSFSGTYSSTTGVRNAISSNSGITWVYSASNTQVVGGNTPVPDNKIGYVQFTPYYNTVTGTVYLHISEEGGGAPVITNLGTHTGSSPKKLAIVRMVFTS
jgi:hypothetical protein